MRRKDFTNKYIESRLGALPSPFDKRNLDYMKFTDLRMADELPLEFTDLLEYAPDNFARNQGNIGSCVGWDGAYVFETQLTLLLKHLKATAALNMAAVNQMLPGVDPMKDYLRLALQDMSAGWAYYWSRKRSRPPVPDHIQGSTNFGLMRAMQYIGICPEVLCTTDTVAPFDKPANTAPQFDAAGEYRIASYHNIPADPVSVKSAMYGILHKLPYDMPDGRIGRSPLVAAFPVYANFKDAYDDGIVPMPEGRLLGGHSSPLYAWRNIDDGEYWGNFGSWGPDIGDNGMFWIPLDYPFYSNDFWLPKILPTIDPPTPTCIQEKENWATRLLNWMNSSDSRYYHGVPVGE